MKGAILCVSMLCLAGILCAPAAGHTNVSVAVAKGMIDSDPNLVVIDVREEGSKTLYGTFCYGHVPPALNYPWNSGVLQVRYTELDPCETILVVCQSGGRSNSAATFLDGQGYFNIYDMLGGTSAWIGAGYATDQCDSDGDIDGIDDDLDNCPSDYNPSQTNTDGDRSGNACDGDCPNLDGVNPVGADDLIVLSQEWLLEGEGLGADLDDSWSVDLYDLEILQIYWGSDCYELP